MTASQRRPVLHEPELPERRQAEFRFLQSEVLANADLAVQAVEHRLSARRGLTSHTAFPNLLAWEEVLLATML